MDMMRIVDFWRLAVGCLDMPKMLIVILKMKR